jgi:phosphoadenosine phosphosulfate reductase
MAKFTDRVLVGFSGGKDSICTLDLCVKHFKKVVPFFMYQVPGLSFQENLIRYYERKYGLEMLRVPHFETSEFLRYGLYREPDYNVPVISTKDLYDHVRQKTGIYWIAGGERIADSIVRRAMIKNSGSISEKRGRFYPIAYWTKKDVMTYMRIKRLPLGADSKRFGCSFRDLSGKSLTLLKDHFPEDFERVKKIYPLCEAAILREAEYGNQQVSELRDGNN